MFLNLIEKIEPCFLLSLMCMFAESNKIKILMSQVTPPNEVPQQLGLEKSYGP